MNDCELVPIDLTVGEGYNDLGGTGVIEIDCEPDSDEEENPPATCPRCDLDEDGVCYRCGHNWWDPSEPGVLDLEDMTGCNPLVSVGVEVPAPEPLPLPRAHRPANPALNSRRQERAIMRWYRYRPYHRRLRH